MAKGSFNIDEFRSTVLGSDSVPGKGLSRNNRFEVIITPPPGIGDSRLVSLYVEQASMPLLNIFAKPFKIFGPTYQRPITSEYGGEGIALTFHVDRNYEVRKFFEDWMHLIVDPDNFTVGYQDEYATTILISQLDEQNNITHEVELLEAFPRNMNLMDLNNASSNQTHRLNVLFAYRYWRRTDSSVQLQATPVPRAIVNPGIPTFDVNLPTPGFSWSGTNVGDYVETGGDSSLPPSA